MVGAVRIGTDDDGSSVAIDDLPVPTGDPTDPTGTTGDGSNHQDGGGKDVGRRDFLGYVVKGTGLAVAVQLGMSAAAPEAAEALRLGDLLDLEDALDLSGTLDVTDGRFVELPEITDLKDLTDLLLLSGDPFYWDFLIRLTPENRVEFELPRMEVGQGILTTAVMILAEELDVRVDQVDASLSPAEFRRATGQITGGSHATTSLWDPLRQVAAQLRSMVVGAAADRFGVARSDVGTDQGMATAPDGRAVPYSDLTDGVEGRNDAARTATPKDPSQYTIVGKPHNRLDAREIVTGRVEYVLDTDPVDGAMPCLVLRPPTLGGSVADYDDSAARAIPGVIAIDVVDIGVEREMTGVAIIAETFGDCLCAQEAIEATWNPGIADDLSDDDIIKTLRAINLPTVPDVPLLTDSIEGEFIFPYMGHAPMETMTSIADVSGGRARVWTGAKTPLAAQAKIARDLGLLPTDVEVHVVKTGGSFGRRLFFDAAVESARISAHFGRPVKFMFTRQEDTKFGRARPLSVHKVQAGFRRGGLFGGPGQVVSFDHRAATPELDLRHGFGDALTAIGAEAAPYGYSQTIWHTTQIVPYAFGATSLLLNEVKFPMPTSSWRSIYSGTAQVANEVMVDELAAELGEDPVDFRLRRLDDDRLAAVLSKVADEGNWGRRMGRGRAQGIGLHKEYKSRAAILMELNTNPSEPRVTRMTAAIDVNRVVNPRGLEGQIISAATDAISAILRTGLHFENGAIRESAYSDFEIARMNNTPPEIDIHFMPPNGERPGGAGELAVPAASAAIANAFARATGIKPRRFPLNEYYPEV